MLVDIVTGASQGIGRAVAEYIAFERQKHEDYLLVLTGRNSQRGSQAASLLQEITPTSFEPCDVSDYEQVSGLKERLRQRVGDDFSVGILVNNAAECPRQQELVSRPQAQDDGSIRNVEIDKQFATNVLGYHFMMKTFQDHFDEGTHVLNIASNWAGSLDLDDLHFRRRKYDNDAAYRQSKLCNRMQTVTWSKLLEGKAVVNSCHPGDPCTTLSTALGYNLGCAPPSRRAVERQSPIPYLCGLSTHSINITGNWFEGISTQPSRCQFAGLTAEQKWLHDICESFCVFHL